MKIAVYSCVTNDYDTIAPPPKWNDVDFILFTDNENYIAEGWDVRLVDKNTYYKYIKMHPHVLLPDYTHYLWIDASMQIIGSKQMFLSVFKSSDFVQFKHPHRSCVFQEIDKCIELKKDTEEILLKQKDYIQQLGITCYNTKMLYQSGTLWIKNTAKNIEFLELWYNETIQFSRRDQISIISTIHKIGWQPKQLEFGYFRQMIKLSKHKKPVQKSDFKIWEFIPFSLEKNFSRAINEYCALVPNENDWIIIRDGDTLHTQSNWLNIVHEVIKNHGNEYALFGAKTNRIGSSFQRVKGMFDEYDIRKHYEKGQELAQLHGTDIEENNHGIAGFFMCFQKKTWDKIKFDESESKCKYFDTYFYQAVRRARLKTADIKGLYILHLYRIWEEKESEAKKSRKHLY